MNNKNTNNKKKIIVLLLLLFVILGIAGYGVYSYYWAQGDYSGSDTISITAFNPETIIDDNSNFLGYGGNVRLTCPSPVSGDTYVTCTGSLEVTNNGATAVQIQVLDAQSGTGSVSEDMTLRPYSPNFNWTTQELSPGETETLNISVETSVSSYYGDSTAHEATQSYNSCVGCQYSTSGQVTVSFKLKATQVHN